MPLYDYRCDDCGAVFEVIEGRSDEHTAPCHRCDGGNIERVEVQKGSTFHLKGSGWERDNYSSHVGDAIKHGGGRRD
jgi:putative FmdB family regulatory protein